VRKTLVTLAFLALISLPIAKAIADDVWIPHPGVFVPNPPQVGPNTSVAASNVAVTPLQADVNLYAEMPNERFLQSGHQVLLGAVYFSSAGHYAVTIHIWVRNPSTKWTYALSPEGASVIDNPQGIINLITFKASISVPDNYLFPWTICLYNTWPTYYEVERVALVADVSATGTATLTQVGCQLQTDLNGDHKVNIIDISVAARHYGEDYGATKQLYAYNVVVDTKIDIMDLKAIAIEFGRTIPP